MATFDRCYRLQIEAYNGQMVIINDPITIDFMVERHVVGGANTMNINIYNLAETTRNIIFQDHWRLNKRYVRLMAGYRGNNGEPQYSTLFTGRMWYCYSTKTKTDIVTQISAFEVGNDVAFADSAFTLDKGSTYKDVVFACLQNTSNLRLGYFEDVSGITDKPYTRPITIFGNSIKQIEDKCPQGMKCFIDNELLYVLKEDTTLEIGTPILNDESGLIGTPQRRDTILVVNSMFQPTITCGQKLIIDSRTEPIFNGDYEVRSVMHKGLISGSVSGNLITEIKLLAAERFTGQ